MLSIIAAIATFVAVVGSYFVFTIRRWRQQLAGLPHPPFKSWLLGNIDTAQMMETVAPPMLHVTLIFVYIQQKFKLPEVFYVDWRPLGPLWIILSDPELATRYTINLPRHDQVLGFFRQFAGHDNVLVLTDRQHKEKRDMFMKGFSAKQVMGFGDAIVDSCLTFIDAIRPKAVSNEIFKLELLASQLALDVMGRVLLDCDFDTLGGGSNIASAYKERVSILPKSDQIFFWQGIDLLRPYKFWKNTRRLNAAVGVEVDRRVALRAQAKAEGKEIRQCVVDFSLDAFDDQVRAGTATRPSNGGIPSSLRDNIIEHVKLFLFAGHDTTSSATCYLFYLLHLHPDVFEKLKAELDAAFGADLQSTAEALKADPHVVNRLEYTNAVIKEAMRIFPPGSTARAWNKSRSESGIMRDPKTGKQFPLIEGALIWINHAVINRNPRFYPEPTKFVPERFIPTQTPYPDTELFTPSGKDAWRIFEKGAYDCMGQNVAMTELRMIVALLAREIDFVVEYPGEEPDVRFFAPGEVPPMVLEEADAAKGKRLTDRWEGYRMYQTLDFTAKPIGGCPGRVRLRRGA